jgi:hypothetical protein
MLQQGMASTLVTNSARPIGAAADIETCAHGQNANSEGEAKAVALTDATP